MSISMFPKKRSPQQDDPLTRRIIACAIEVHKRLGPDLLEKLYSADFVLHEARWQESWLAY
jgi:hypothetical protein